MKKLQRIFSYCPVELQKKLDQKIKEIIFYEKDYGGHEEFITALPSVSRKLVEDYVRFQNIAIEFELKVEHSNEINKYKEILRN